MAEVATIDELRRLLQYITKGYKVPNIVYKTVFDVAVREVEEKKRVVMLKRDPNIARNRIQSTYVKVIDGATIEISPAIVGGFGADFDGDQMAIFAPLSEEAQNEAREKMLVAVAATSVNAPQFKVDKEVYTGLFTMTYEEEKGKAKKIDSVEEAEKLHIATPVTYNGVKTTAGRVIFNGTLPSKYPFVNEPVDKKKVNFILEDLISKDHSVYITSLDKIMKIGFKYATMYPRSISLDMLESTPELKKLKIKLGKETDLIKQNTILNEMDEVLEQNFKDNHPHLYEQIKSGAAKGSSQIRQVAVAKGLIKNAKGEILPALTKSINEGFTPEEYFDAAAGSRKGIVDRVHNTAHGGYAYRKMVYVLGNCVADINTGNCGTKRTLNLKLTKNLFKRMKGRFIQKGDKLYPVTEKMIGDIIPLRSPVYCKSGGLCRTCYGDLIKQLKTNNVGIIAAQEVTSLSEKIMKSFHTGGMLELKIPVIKDELMNQMPDKYREKIDKVCTQKESDLITNASFTSIDIDKSIYVDKYKIEEDDQFINLPVGYFSMAFENFQIESTMEVKVSIYKENVEREENDDHILLTFLKGSKLFKVEPISIEPALIANTLDAFVGGKSPWTTPESLYNKFYFLLSDLSDWDSTHLETILSNILRSKKDPQIPARMKEPYDPVLYSIKSLPGIMSWPLGLAFENFSQGITRGLISDRAPESDIEKVMFGEPLSDVKQNERR